VLMLIFQSLQTSAPDGFMAAFQTTFRIAAMIPAALVVLDLRRPRPRAAVASVEDRT
jgi:hypothetical protein